MSSITHGLQHKLMHVAISKGPAARQFRFVISSESVDRDRDIIKLDAWDFEEYRRNPVVLASHDHQRLPVAKSVDIGVRGDKVLAVAEFPPKGMYEFADTVHDMVEAGFLKAASVGFRATQAEPNGLGGQTITKATLLEWSICSIGSNPDAMVERAAPAVMRKWLQSKHQQKEDDMPYVEIDDEPYLELKDDDPFDEMCRQMLATYSEMDSDKFRELMARQLALLGPAASIADLVRSIMQQGVVSPPKSWRGDDERLCDVDERQLGRLIAEVLSEETANATKAAFNAALGRLD